MSFGINYLYLPFDFGKQKIHYNFSKVNKIFKLLEYDLFCFIGQAHEEGGNLWQVWYKIRCLAQKDCEEDGSFTAF